MRNTFFNTHDKEAVFLYNKIYSYFEVYIIMYIYILSFI